MAQPDFFREAFNLLAHNGCIGDPQGEPAYAYLRVSSAGQADEGRSGLPRQIQHCHEIGLQKGVKIPWELVFADDHSGFDFRDRPDLSRLREEYKQPSRRANVIVMEYLDRLSRNADWHQGFLLDEMKEYHLRFIFWKEFTSRVERAVMGAISQEGMEQAKQRMAEGDIYKAKDKRVTARTAAFGYLLVNRYGETSADAKKDSHYALHPSQAPIVQHIFQKIGVEGWSLRRLAKWLDQNFGSMKRKGRWEPRLLWLMIRNPVYYGQFAAHRYTYAKVQAKNQRPGLPTQMVWKKIERPRSEWIMVPVPPLVSKELWDMANRILDKNAGTGRRNAKQPYLLTGLVQCATCGYTYVGGRKIKRKGGKEYLIRFYRDLSKARLMGIFRDVNCPQSQVSCTRLDTAVWKVVSAALLQPQIIIEAMEQQFLSGTNAQLQKEIDYLLREISELEKEDEGLYRAYRAGAFDAVEFAAKREGIKERRRGLEKEKGDLQSRVLTREKFELNKQQVLTQTAILREHGLTVDPPFEIKQSILKLVVDQIKLNVNEGWFEIEGVLRGRFEVNESIVCIPVDRDSLRPRIENWRGR